VHPQLLPISAKPVLTLEKDGLVLPFDAFSEGERSAIAMVADIARRLALLDTNGASTAQRLAREGVVMIDELEQHLHPKWQRWFIKQLPRTFPGLQFIVTTQSPIVVSEVAQENLRVLSAFKLVDIHHHRGRDANSVLEETFETPSRPEEIEKQLDSLADKLDDRDLEQAGKLLDALAATLGETDGDIVYYRNILERLRPAE
jgi:predicted ATP-binding protein involved in virulence